MLLHQLKPDFESGQSRMKAIVESSLFYCQGARLFKFNIEREKIIS